MLKTKRAYEDPDASDGYRVLVDRLWPRGVTKERARIDCWMKELAPSSELRKWFGHDPNRFAEFAERYRKELAEQRALIKELRALEREHKTVTLVYAAKDEEHNNAVALKDILKR